MFKRLLRGLNLFIEKNRAIPGIGEIPSTDVLEFHEAEQGPERFSLDRDWMPHLVLLAKNSYVWLNQLSKKYQHPITRLDQIPDEELDLLAQRGFSGLWLIGLWKRSRASQRIKQLTGYSDAVASAYALDSYEIANDLGGWEALGNLRQRAWQRGIRLAADMVPNHMGIDSEWVIDHPERFLALPSPPFPSYSYNGADLSEDPRVGIFIEDHYYTRSDAAVVFKRLDRRKNETSYIYHGNDGTSMPWNDTAQLDYLNPETREAVIQTILRVARHFPIIRFDAAMTLVKRHIQRLWYPEPGKDDAIPSRCEHGLSKEQFEAALPDEFWREVVDRVSQELPDTLLLAEAYWLMEGYFVRELGMHRVYNSAFMHMLRDEDNAKYRLLLKNVLEFDPEILKRFVNYMSNPDEEPAAEQFDIDEKYFGVCTLLATLPGLPMFGHGQIEGFREKYGMDFHRARWKEPINERLVQEHERRIFPLLRRRRVFNEIVNFLLYDFYTPKGDIDQGVIAYSNRSGDERGLVIYNNQDAEAKGRVRTSTAYFDRRAGKRIQRTLVEGLEILTSERDYVIFRDYVTGLEHIHPCQELVEKGLYVELEAYQCHAFLDFRFVNDDSGQWLEVCRMLNGAATPSIEKVFQDMYLPVRKAAKKRRKT